jgi:hypothetical protein
MTLENAKQKIVEKVLSLRDGWNLLKADNYVGHCTAVYAHDLLPKEVLIHIYGGYGFDQNKCWVTLSDRSPVGDITDIDFIKSLLKDIMDRNERFTAKEIIKMAQSI